MEGVNRQKNWRQDKHPECPNFSVSRAMFLARLFDGGIRPLDLRQHVLIRRAGLIIDFDEFPAHDAGAVDYVSRGVRPAAFGLIVEQSVTVNHTVAGV
jgi:hypothetical protein